MAPMNGSHSSTTETDSSTSRSEQVSFRFHPRVLAALGRDLITDDVVAVMELVKNSYDALATQVEVRIRSSENGLDGGSLEVTDDGHGMDYGTIKNAWGVIATPFKKEQPVPEIDGRSRTVTGDKGLGRLSAARLGSEIAVVTKTADGPVLSFLLNWDHLLDSEDIGNVGFKVSHLPAEAFEKDHGTRIRIRALRRIWGKEEVEDLRQNLARLVSPFATMKDFSLRLIVPGDSTENSVQDISPPDFMSQPKYAIEGHVDDQGRILGHYRYRPIDGSTGREKEIDDSSASHREEQIQLGIPGFDPSTPRCGPFEFEVRAWDLTKDDTRDIADHFAESRSNIRGAIYSQRGVSVYRDDILVLPKSDGARDWLGLDLRRVSRVGPRLSTSQIVGCVRITKSDNPKIQDTSDREGLVEDPPAVTFRDLVTRIVSLLEGERHQDRMGTKETVPARELFRSLNAAPLVSKIESLRTTGGSVSEALEAAKAFKKDLDESRAVIERRFGYYNRLAVIGTIAQMVIHEIRNRTTVIGRGLRKAAELIDRLPDGDSARALQPARNSVGSLEALAKRFAPLASRGYRAGKRPSVVEESIHRCLEMQEKLIRRGRVIVEEPEEARTIVRIDPGEIDTVILNLVINSLYWLQQHDGERRLRFRVTRQPSSDRVTVSLDDSGPGIDPDYRERVFWPGVTSKPDGFGMGLTVASELVDGHGGKMRTLVPGELGGATFEFDVPLASDESGEKDW